MTLADFLLACIAEDERRCGSVDGEGLRFCGADEGDHYTAARVLAEVEAKARLVEHHEPTTIGSAQCIVCRGEDGDEWTNQPWPCLTLRLLALPYADHEDFLPEWRP